MAMPPCGTFAYVISVPGPVDDATPWPVASFGSVVVHGSERTDNRLVGYEPTLTISDAGITRDDEIARPGGARRPRVLRRRLTLTATGPHYATVATASFCVDHGMINALQVGDKLYVARTTNAGLGLSILRGDDLIAAAGAVTAVPLGPLVAVRTPREVVEEARALFRKIDPDFEFRETPIEIRVGDRCLVTYAGRPTLNGYQCFVAHGFAPGLPSFSECVAIARKGTCPDVAAIATAQLLDEPDPLQMTRW